MNLNRKVPEEFVNEVKEHLAAIEVDLFLMEKLGRGYDKEIIDKIFRNIHTIKGNAGFFSCHAIEKICMDIEEELEEIREGKQQISAHVVSIVLQYLDRIRGEINVPANTLLCGKPVSTEQKTGNRCP